MMDLCPRLEIAENGIETRPALRRPPSYTREGKSGNG